MKTLITAAIAYFFAASLIIGYGLSKLQNSLDDNRQILTELNK